MGKFFRNGRLHSADTFSLQGTRTLAAATESDLWPGTDATRPVPGSIQLRLVSTSVEDDTSKAEKQTITVTGTMDPVTTDVWTCTLGGNVDTADIARLTLDGVHFDTSVEGGATLATLAAAVKDGAMSGTFDTWTATVGGTQDAGDVARLTLDGVNYDYTVLGGDTAANIATGVAAAAAADPNYDVSAFSDRVRVKRKVRGANAGSVASTYSTDPGLDSTFVAVHTITGQNSQSAWTVTDDTVSAVICTRATPGATAGTVASSYVSDPGTDSTFSAVHTTTGADADVVAVTDGTTTWSHTVVAGNTTTTVAAALAALIDASASYSASNVNNVITVQGLDGVDISFSDASTDNQTADMGVAIATTQTSGGGSGIRTVRLDYLDANGVRQSESVNMNGLSAVTTTATDVTAILGITATTVGSGGAAAGTISCTNTGNTSTFEVITAGANQTGSAAYKVPASQRAYVTALHLSAGATATTIRLKSDANPATGSVVSGASFTWHSALVGTDPATISPLVPIGPFPASAKVWLTGTHAAGTAVIGTIEGYLEPSQGA